MNSQNMNALPPTGTEQAYTCHWIKEHWLDVALIVSFVACLTIAVLATMGYLDRIGAMNAAYLSYGLYGGAVVAFSAEIGNLAARACQPASVSSPAIKTSFRPKGPEVSVWKRETARVVYTHAQTSTLVTLKEGADSKLQVHFDEIESFLAKSTYNDELEYYSFHYHLSTISVYILEHKTELKDDWENFLKTIDGLKINGNENRPKYQIDCSRELMRLKGERPQLKVIQIDDPKDSNVRVANEIIREAFGPFDSAYPSEHDRCFIAYEERADKNEVVGCIFLRDWGNGVIMVHTLARRASAVRWGITELFAEHLSTILASEKGKKIICRVDLHNAVAIKIYKKLGFAFQPGKKGEQGFMEYNPKSQGF